jgi:uncharacterized protein
MGKSLQDQLLNAGLVDKGREKTVKAEKRKKIKQQRKNKVEIIDENKLLAQKSLTEKASRDRELNLKRKKEAELKAITAQIKQLIDLNRIQQKEDGMPYNFTDAKKVKRIYIDESTRELLTQGKLAIVKLENKYDVVPTAIADKIASRDKNLVIVRNEPKQENSDIDGPYADYQIPDDLLW